MTTLATLTFTDNTTATVIDNDTSITEKLVKTALDGDGKTRGDIQSIVITISTTVIGEFAFYDCSELETVTFNDVPTLLTIGDYAFNGCTALTSFIANDKKIETNLLKR